MLSRRTPPDSRIERQLITGMIVSERFIREIKPVLRMDSLQLPFARTIALWCLDFFDNHNAAPGKMIQDIFIEKRKRDIDEDQAELIEEFLSSISEEYTRQDVFNIDYYLKKCEEHIRTVSAQNLGREILKAASSGRIEEAEALAKGYERPLRPVSSGVDPINDNAAIANAFSTDSGDKLFSAPGTLGKIINEFERGWLYSIVGSKGAGKSWWLMLLSLRALFAGFNVIFISLEMSKKSMIRRIHHYINGLPTKKWAGELLIPVFDCIHNQAGTCDFRSKRVCKVDLIKNEEIMSIPKTIKQFDDFTPRGYTPCTACMRTKNYSCTTWFKKVTKEELSLSQALKKKQAVKRSAMVRGSKFHLVEFPSGTLTMSELRAYLYNLEQYEGFIPDVITTDYPDKQKPERNKEHRHGIHEIWEAQKGLAQDKNALSLVASQSNTARTGKKIRSGDWADDIRKFNLVDGAISLNMSPEQKERGVIECGIMGQRHDYFDAIGAVYVLHQLKIGRPYLDSYKI